MANPPYPSGSRAAPPRAGAVGAVAPRPGEAGTGIEVSPLSGTVGDGVGLIGPADGGAPPSLWQGSRRLTIEDGLAALTPPPATPAIGALYRKVLISRGKLPAGASAGHSALALRLQALYAAGFAAEADALAGRVPMSFLSAPAATAAARAALALDMPDKACGYLPRLPTDGAAGDPFLRFALELAALCQTRAGLQVAALLTVDLVREQSGSDSAFVALATRAAGGPDLDIPSDETLTSLHYALAREAGVSLPETAAARAEPALWPALADDAALPWRQRLALAETAAARGLIGAEDVTAAYQAAIAADAHDANPRVRAFALSRDATTTTSSDAASHLPAIATAFAETPVTLWPAIAPVFFPLLRTLTPDMAQAEHAVFMVEVLSLARSPVGADAWIGVAATAAPDDIGRLEALVRVATPADASSALPWNADLALTSVDVRLADATARTKWLTAFELQALASLGLPLPPSVWAQFDDAQMPGIRLSDADLRALRVAAEGRRPGEAALATFAALAPDPQDPDSQAGLPPARAPWALTPGSLAAIITALARAGLEADARQIAVEALVVRAHGEA